MIIGYARISTTDQKLDLQLDALTKAGADRIFEDKMSGARDSRPGLTAALSHLREGDTLVVWKLDRLGRRTLSLITFFEELRGRGIEFRSVTEGIDTSTPMGRLIYTFFAGVAQMERDLIRERTHAGLAAARARGRFGGRPAKLSSKQAAHALKLLEDRSISIKSVAESFGVDRATIYRVMAKAEAKKRAAA